jgi:hypothetical protein
MSGGNTRLMGDADGGRTSPPLLGRGITAPNRGDNTLVANDDDTRETESDATPISGAYGDANMRALGDAIVSAATDATESIVSSKSEEKHSLAG